MSLKTFTSENKQTLDKDRLIDDIYPFADDSFGNFICFDYWKGKDKPPKVVC